MNRVDQWELVAAVAIKVAVVCIQTGNAKRKGTAGHVIPVSAYSIATKLDKLARIARTLHRYYEWQCNEDTSPHTCKACGGSREGGHTFTNCAGAKVYTLQGRAEKIGADLGIVVENQTDPRGAPVKLWADKVDGRSLGVMGLS